MNATEPRTAAELPKRDRAARIKAWGTAISWAVLFVAVVLLIHTFVVQPYRVDGASMQPALQNSDYLVISKLDQTMVSARRTFGDKSAAYSPGRGQIVVFHYPPNPALVYVKRVVGLPGDHVVIKGGKVTVYDAAHPGGFNPDASYEDPEETVTLGDVDVTVEAGKVFVLGDNRLPGKSSDSRSWGQLPVGDIIGNAVLRLWPLKAVRAFE